MPEWRRGGTILAGGVLAVSTAGIFIRLANGPAAAIAAWRMIFAALIFIAAGFRAKRPIERPPFKYIFWGSIFLAGHFAAWITSVTLTTVASAQMLVTTEPLFAAVIGSLLLKERPTWQFWLGTVLALGGAALVGFGDFSLTSRHLVGDGLAILGAAIAAAYLVCGRAARKFCRLEDYLRWVYGGAAIWLSLYAVLSGTSLFGLTLTGLYWVLAMALMCQVVGHSLLNLAVRFYPAHLVTMGILGEGILGAGWAALALREYPSKLFFAGAPLLLLGVMVALSRSKGSRIST